MSTSRAVIRRLAAALLSAGLMAGLAACTAAPPPPAPGPAKAAASPRRAAPGKPAAQPAAPVSDDVALLSEVLGIGKDKDEFYERADVQFDRLVQAGILDDKVQERFDYTSYFPPRREVRFHGAKLLYFEYEYLDEFIGCCVDDGFGLVLQGKPDSDAVAFAHEHECSIRAGEEVYLPDELKVDRSVEIYELSCRFSDSEGAGLKAASGLIGTGGIS